MKGLSSKKWFCGIARNKGVPHERQAGLGPRVPGQEYPAADPTQDRGGGKDFLETGMIQNMLGY